MLSFCGYHLCQGSLFQADSLSSGNRLGFLRQDYGKAGLPMRLTLFRLECDPHLIPSIVGTVALVGVGPDQDHGPAIVIDPLRAELEAISTVLFPVAVEVLGVVKLHPWSPWMLCVPEAKTARKQTRGAPTT